MPKGKKAKSTGKGDRMILPGTQGPERRHYCPKCPADEAGRLQPMRPVRIIPGGMRFACEKGNHQVQRTETILA